MRILFFVLPLVVALSGCKKIKPGCILAEKASPPITDFIVKKAACKKPEVMHQAVLSFCNNDLGLCKDDVKQTGPIAAIICPIIGSYGKVALEKKLSESDLLKRAECDPNVAASSIADPLIAACMALPF